MNLIIETNDINVLNEFLKDDKPDGLNVYHRFTESIPIDETPQVYTFILEWAYPVLAPIISQWIYDKLKNSKSSKTTINKIEAPVEQTVINNIIINIIKEQNGTIDEKPTE